MAEQVVPTELQLPADVQQRPQSLIDKQNQGEELTSDERVEAAGLVDLAELLSLLKLRARRIAEAASQ